MASNDELAFLLEQEQEMIYSRIRQVVQSRDDEEEVGPQTKRSPYMPEGMSLKERAIQVG